MKIKFLPFLSVLFFFFSCQPEKVQKNNPFSVMAYYVPSETSPPEQLQLDKLTHIIFSFTKVIDGEMKFRNQEETGEILKRLVAQREKYPNLKIMVACGGWGADGFSDMASTEENRRKFVNSVVKFNKTYKLDGLDIDWEYPGIPAADTKARKEDKENFTLLMKSLREHLDSLDRKQTLTFAAAGWKGYFENLELLEVMKYVDYINLMTYDQRGASSPYTGHHTALGKIKMEDLTNYPMMEYLDSIKAEQGEEFSWEPQSAESITQFCLNQGVKPEQIVIGAAFYGRSWKGVAGEFNGLYQPNKGAFIGGCPYHKIRDEFEQKNGYTRYWDSIAKAPYLFNATDSVFFSYDDTASVKLKTMYAKDKQLGGIMFWQLSHDTKEKDGLLDAIYEASGLNSNF